MDQHYFPQLICQGKLCMIMVPPEAISILGLNHVIFHIDSIKIKIQNKLHGQV